ncbi:MAG TPA: hypothetical protein VLC09_19040 [Polyangiaceae bacterium]|nr:hypothetical protein [Polyangiaceae bacterium]
MRLARAWIVLTVAGCLGACGSAGVGDTPGDTSGDDSGDDSSDSSGSGGGDTLEPVCEADSESCHENDRIACDATGSSFTVLEACTAQERCDARAAACVALGCTAGEPVCDGDVATLCAADGSAPEPGGTNCADDGEVCIEGSCAPRICTVEYHCDGSTLRHCEEDGTSSSVVEVCGGGTFCQEGKDSCQPEACEPDSGYCLDNVALHCRADGSGPIDAGEDCGDEICVSGTCEAAVCPASSYFCDAGNVRLCDSLGLSSVLGDACDADEHCVPGSASCKADTCSKGASYCTGNTKLQCKADGSGTVDAGTACGTDICSQGECLPRVCTYNYECFDGNLYQCNGGTSKSLLDTCTAGEFCANGYSSCRPDVCTAGASVCVNERIATCQADGSGPGTAADCPNSQTCAGNACVDVICESAFQYSCVAGTNGDRLICNDNGTGYQQTTNDCVANRYCEPASGTCVRDTCNPGTMACNGEQRATCNAFGNGYTTPTGTNCGSTGQVCTLSGCAANAREGWSPTALTHDQPSPNLVIGHYFRVDKARQLDKIELQLRLTSAASTVTWVVYESTGPYSQPLIYSQEVTPAYTGVLTWYDSGTIAVQLQPEHEYLIGAYVKGISEIKIASQSPPVYFSFGSWGGSAINESPTLPSNNAYGNANYQMPLYVTTSMAP